MTYNELRIILNNWYAANYKMLDKEVVVRENNKDKQIQHLKFIDNALYLTE